MKLDDAYMVCRMADLRRKLIAQRDEHKVVVTLSGPTSSEQLDPVFVDQLRPLISAELSRRILLLERDLESVGVSVD